MRTLLEIVQKTNRRHRLFGRGDGIVVGLSGGPDSTALLHLLTALRRKYGLRLFAAHVNHGLSAREASTAEKFSEALCVRLGVPFFKKKIRLRELAARHKKTPEEMGRIERYRFFSEIARKTGARKIATAHTLDDQAETVLMRIVRGAGLKGLGGIPVERSEGPLAVIRPLLHCRKKELLIFLKENDEPFCLDSSNGRDIFTRNVVRNRWLPRLRKEMNPRIDESLADLAEICAESQSFLEDFAAHKLKKCLLRKGKGGVFLSVAALKRLPPAVLSEALFQALASLKNGRVRFGAAHIRTLRELLDSPEGRLETHLPGPVLAVKEKGKLRIFDSAGK